MFNKDLIKDAYVKKSEQLCDININRAIHLIGDNSAFTWSARTADGSRVDYVFLNQTGGTLIVETKTRNASAENHDTCILEATKKEYLQWLARETGAKVFYVAQIGDGRRTYWFEISRIPESAWEYRPKWKCYNPVRGKHFEPCYAIPWEYATRITKDGLRFCSNNLPMISATPFDKLQNFCISGHRLGDLTFEKIKY